MLIFSLPNYENERSPHSHLEGVVNEGVEILSPSSHIPDHITPANRAAFDLYLWTAVGKVCLVFDAHSTFPTKPSADEASFPIHFASCSAEHGC